MEEKEIFHAPQVLLLGNGLNRSYGGYDWKKVVEAMWKNQKITMKRGENIPFPLQVVVGSDDTIDQTLKEKPDFIYGLNDLDEIRKPLEKLLSVPFDHILTTNYSYELERVLNPNVKRNGEYCKKIASHTEGSKTVEIKYLLHTYNQLATKDHTHKIWHIHGEARKPNSIVLGHYNYGQLLYRYIAELNARHNVQMERQKIGKQPIIKSWLDAFVMGDVYVLGFGYDFSEMDLWWLLNRKKREKAQHGKVFFYEPSYGKIGKLALMEAYDAEVKDMGYDEENPDYVAFYEKAIGDIIERVKEK